MAAAPLRRAAAPLVALLISTSFLALPGLAQTAPECVQGSGSPEDHGPTDITAVTGNQRLSVAINAEGTVTVLRWPSPSFYDQIKYRTFDRSEPHMGSLPNEGAFIGIAWREPSDEAWDFLWMRDVLQAPGWVVRQRFADDDTDQVVTTYSHRASGLIVTLRDVVAPTRDALVRRISVSRSAVSDPLRVRVFSFANFNPVFSKARRAPYRDWCGEANNDSGAAYDAKTDAVTAQRSGTDDSTGEPSSVAVAMAFSEPSSQYQIGQDTYQAAATGTSAYDDAQDGELSGVDSAAGQADAALARDLDLTSVRRRSASVVIAAAPDTTAALRHVEQIRKTGAAEAATDKARWWRAWLKPARLPDGAPDPVRRLAKRTLISIRQATDPGGLIVASIATQPSYSLDWIRDGAYVNRALHAAGHPAMVEEHNLRYAALQSTTASSPPGGDATPPGNWAENYYADGVVGGPVPYQIDQTGLGLWTLWDHYVQTKDADYLLEVYEAIQRGAQYLTDVCRDPATGLQCAAPEGDSASPTRTLRGAQAVWLGLDAAARAAKVKAQLDPSGRTIALSNSQKWRARSDEVSDAILDEFYDEACRCFTEDPLVGGTFLWPARAIDYAGKAPGDQARTNWAAIRPALEDSVSVGGMESQTIVGNAFTWTRATDERRIRRALRWVATVPTTNATGLLGAAWSSPGDGSAADVVTMQGQPHVPSMAMFYLAALKAYGSERWSSK